MRLEGQAYRIAVDLAPEVPGPRASAEIVVHAKAGRSLAPIVIRGAGGWVSGYTVPVMSGALEGSIRIGRERVDLSGGTGYHDHNWGFWDGVRWQWGQMQSEDVSFVYGRVHPPADAADESRLPGFSQPSVLTGRSDTPPTSSIEETNDPSTERPRRIVSARSQRGPRADDGPGDRSADSATKMGKGLFGGGLDFLQLRATYCRVGKRGRPGNQLHRSRQCRDVSGRAAGSAE